MAKRFFKGLDKTRNKVLRRTQRRNAILAKKTHSMLDTPSNNCTSNEVILKELGWADQQIKEDREARNLKRNKRG